MTLEKFMNASSPAQPFQRNKLPIIKTPDLVSRRMSEDSRLQSTGKVDAPICSDQADAAALAGASPPVTPVDRFAYLSIRQSQGMTPSGPAAQKSKLIKINPVTPFL